MASKVVSLLIVFVIIKIAMTDNLNVPAKIYSYLISSGIHSEGKNYSTYCKTDRRCVCNEELEGYSFNCENEFHARSKVISKGRGTITVNCNETIQAQQLRQEYFSAMKLGMVENLELILTGCPAPAQSYASLFEPSSKSSENTGETSGVQFSVLRIDCGGRKDFPITKEHFDLFIQLEEMKISCGALSDLPSDLFHGHLPNLRHLEISETIIKRIPEGIFSKLPNLESLFLRGNRIEKLNKHHLYNLSSLKVLKINENRLSSLEADAFSFTTALENLEISNSKISNTFKSIWRLVNLKRLVISGNSINSIEAGDCVRLPNIEDVEIMNNRIKLISPECFASFSEAKYIDLSGNSISSLPDEAILMKNLFNFKFKDNSVTILRVSQFIVSNMVRNIVMTNSLIESFDPDFLHRLPNLEYIDLSGNKLSALHEDFFAHNPDLGAIVLRQNRLISLSANIFSRNPGVTELYISSNNISSLPPSLFTNLSSLGILELSNNNLEVLSKSLLANLRELVHLDVSTNKIHTIENDSFKDLHGLGNLLLNHNMLNNISPNIFSPFKDFGSLMHLDLESNLISSLPRLDIPSLQTLNLANNCLKGIDNDSFTHLTRIESINLSRNDLVTLPDSPLVTHEQKLLTLDLSFNGLSEIPENTLRQAIHIVKIDLSGNKIKSFCVKWISSSRKLRELDLSNNSLFFIKCDPRFVSGVFGRREHYYSRFHPVKILNLSNNDINFNYSSWLFDEVRKTWGRVSPLACLDQLEELHLANNSITEVFMDWRNTMPHLRLLDLRYNKFEYLTHQDLLYSSSIVYESGTAEPYNCTHFLNVDLRHNLIRGVEVPEAMLIEKIPRDGEKRIYSHATVLMDDNPFSCGCAMLKFLRLLYEDVILTSELWRTERKDWILPARIDVGNLSCSEPKTVRGKMLADPEAWMHHLLPLFGLCSFI